jgi:hypothetical protein
VKNNTTGQLDEANTPDGINKLLRAYSAALGFEIGAHSLRATAATNAPDHEADIARCRNGLGMPTSPPRAFTIIGARGRRTARRSKWLIHNDFGP